jgi:exonuclease III
MRFGTWNVRSLCRLDAIKSVVGELEKCKLDLVGVQEVRWEGKGREGKGRDIKQQTILYFSMEKGMLITN